MLWRGLRHPLTDYGLSVSDRSERTPMSGVCWLVVAVVLAASYLIPTAVFAILERRDKRAALRRYDKIMALHGYHWHGNHFHREDA